LSSEGYPQGYIPDDAQVAPAISSDGRYVSFVAGFSPLAEADESSADNYASPPGAYPGTGVFRYDLTSQSASVVTQNPPQEDVDEADSVPVAVSANGQYAVFVGSPGYQASGYVNNGGTDVFVRNLETGATQLVSVSLNGGTTVGGNGDSGSGGPLAFSAYGNVAISANGRYVAFTSSATDLTPDDTGGLFVRDLATNVTALVDPNGTSPMFSPDGNGWSTAAAATQAAAASAPSP
jgi:hypothetical protein